jgi:hypothetical protein
VSLALASRRAAISPSWVRNALWRNARAVPSLDLQFADTKSLADAISGQNLITFTRASSATYVGSDGLIKTAATNEPRFDHNPTTGESLGLLPEEQRTNLLLQSQDFSTTWTNSGSSENVNVIAAPDGTLTADALVDTTVSEVHNLAQSVAGLAGSTAYTFSCFMKKGSKDFGLLSFTPNASWAAGAGAAVFFNLANGTVGTTTNATGTIQAFPNGWYRCTATATTAASPGTVSMRIGASLNGSAQTYAGAADEALYLWGAQLEAGAFPTSYIPTTTAAVTRSADVASITGTNFSSWYRQDEGTFFSLSSVPSPAAYTGRIYTAGVGTDNISAFRQSDFQPVLRFRVSNADQALLGLGATWTDSLPRRLGQVYRVDDFAGAVNGGSVSVDTSGSLPTVSALSIGNQDSASFFNGHIRRLTFWPQRLPNSTLQAITQ